MDDAKRERVQCYDKDTIKHKILFGCESSRRDFENDDDLKFYNISSDVCRSHSGEKSLV